MSTRHPTPEWVEELAEKLDREAVEAHAHQDLLMTAADTLRQYAELLEAQK